MTRSRVLALSVVVLLGLGGMAVLLWSGGVSERRFRAADHQDLVGLERERVLRVLDQPAELEWLSMDSFYHGTIHELRLRGMSVVCYGDWVVAVEPNER